MQRLTHRCGEPPVCEDSRAGSVGNPCRRRGGRGSRRCVGDGCLPRRCRHRPSARFRVVSRRRNHGETATATDRGVPEPRTYAIRAVVSTGGTVARIVLRASSGVLVLPTITNPAVRRRRTTTESSGAVQPRSRSSAIPACSGSPAVIGPMSLNSTGTPRNGPSPRWSWATTRRAPSYSGVTTAFSVGLCRSIRSNVTSKSS